MPPSANLSGYDFVDQQYSYWLYTNWTAPHAAFTGARALVITINRTPHRRSNLRPRVGRSLDLQHTGVLVAAQMLGIEYQVTQPTVEWFPERVETSYSIWSQRFDLVRR